VRTAPRAIQLQSRKFRCERIRSDFSQPFPSTLSSTDLVFIHENYHNGRYCAFSFSTASLAGQQLTPSCIGTFQPSSQASCHLLALAPELQLEIFKNLHPVSSTCLGLTCKPFYAIHRELHGTVALDTSIWFEDCKGEFANPLGSFLLLWAGPDLYVDYHHWAGKFRKCHGISQPSRSALDLPNGRSDGPRNDTDGNLEKGDAEETLVGTWWKYVAEAIWAFMEAFGRTRPFRRKLKVKGIGKWILNTTAASE